MEERNYREELQRGMEIIKERNGREEWKELQRGMKGIKERNYRED